MVPDLSFDGLGHFLYQILYHISTMYVILVLYANFQLPSMIRSASGKQLYLEDVDGSWLEFWRIGLSVISNLMSWINILCYFELYADFQLHIMIKS